MSNKDEVYLSPTQWAVNMIKCGYSLEDISRHLRFPSVSGCLNELMGKNNCSVEVLAGMASVNPATIHKIMAKKMRPGRNLLLRIALSLKLSFEETQVLLKTCNCAPLSGMHQRDLYIMEGIQKKFDYDIVNNTLEKDGFPTLMARG